MSTSQLAQQWSEKIPEPILVVLRGIGQILFQENALTGALFVLGIALSSPVMAVGIVLGAAIGTAVGWFLKFDRTEVLAGIYGFNAALVGIATWFFFQPGLLSIVLLVVGCIAATALTRFLRGYVPFPTYTTPFVVTTWVVHAVGQAWGAVSAGPGYFVLIPEPPVGSLLEATAHGVSQIMFQASIWTAVLFVVGVAVGDRRHAGWLVVGSLVGMIFAAYHVDAGMRAIDPERLVERTQFENIQLGLYGYNAAVVAIALWLWRRSILTTLFGIFLTVPLTEWIPRLGVPALTAPFVVAAWLTILLIWLDRLLLQEETAPVPD
ncbi:MAG: urea transporter [Pirellulaceae bacterium]|nr:urea transporter [Pirellulaceae bacterium]